MNYIVYVLKRIIILLSFLLSFASLPAQITEQRLYIHSDRQCYTAGETIWLNAYLYRQFAPDDEITNLWIQLTDAKGRLISEKRLVVFYGSAEGYIDLNVHIPEGIYLLKAITKRGIEIISTIAKTLYIFNPESALAYTRDTTSHFNTRIFASNNQLVAGLSNTIYFKVTLNNNPLPEFTGSLIDGSEQFVVAFKNELPGIGSVEWVPGEDKSYSLKIDFPASTGINNSSAIYNLPPVSSRGLVISAIEEKENVLVSIRQNGKMETQPLTVIGMMGTVKAFDQKFELSKSGYNIKIPTAGLPAGILHLAVMSGSKSIADTKVFIHKNPYTVEVKKERDSLTLLFPPGIIGTFSVSVTDYEKEIPAVHNDMYHELLINQEDPQKLTVIEATELSNKNLVDLAVNASLKNRAATIDQAKEPLPDTNFLSVKGKVIGRRQKQPLSLGSLIIFYKGKDSSTAFFNPVISEDGSFQLRNLIFFDTAQFSYHWEGKKNGIVILDTLDNSNIKNYPAPVFFADRDVFFKTENITRAKETYSILTEAFSKAKLLQGVTVTASRSALREQLNRKYSTGLFSSTGMSRILDLVNDPPPMLWMNIFDYIQGKIPGLVVRRLGGVDQYSLSSLRGTTLLGQSPDIKVYLDEVETTISNLVSVQLAEVAMIKYFPPGTARLTFSGNDGVLIVYTRKIGDRLSQPSDEFARNFKVAGYSPLKDFDYAGSTTLYWNPRVIIDGAENNFGIKLEKGSAGKKLHIVAEGFTLEGEIIHLDTVIDKE